jgi:hypothetical protein
MMLIYIRDEENLLQGVDGSIHSDTNYCSNAKFIEIMLRTNNFLNSLISEANMT